MQKLIQILFYFLLSCNIYAEDQVIKIAISESPPFEFFDNGNVVGINQMTISDVFNRIGYKAEFYPFPWKRALVVTESGDMDAIASIQESPDQVSTFIFSAPIMYTQNFLLKNKSLTATPKNFEDLKAYKIGIIDDYFYGEAFNKAILPNLSPLASASPDAENLEKLSSGRIDFVACSIHVCKYWINKYKKVFSNIEYLNLFPIDSGHTLHLAFSRKNLAKSQEIVQKFNIELAKYIAEGNIEKNIVKYPDLGLTLDNIDYKK